MSFQNDGEAKKGYQSDQPDEIIRRIHEKLEKEARGEQEVKEDKLNLKPSTGKSPIKFMQKEIEIIETRLNDIKQGIDMLQKDPIGDKKTQPGTSCGEIRMIGEDAITLGISTEKLQNGTYWIDPNQGYHGDSFRVDCSFDMHFTSTCMDMDYNNQGFRENYDKLYSLSQFNFLFWHALYVEQEFYFVCDKKSSSKSTLALDTLIFEAHENTSITEDEILEFINLCSSVQGDLKPEEVKALKNKEVMIKPDEKDPRIRKILDEEHSINIENDVFNDPNHPNSKQADPRSSNKYIKVKLKTAKSRRLPVRRIYDNISKNKVIAGRITSRICFIEDYGSYEVDTDQD